MPIKNPKTKGGNFERKICKAISLWVSEGKDDNLFWRSAISGGRATVRSKKGQKTNNQAGDITAISPEGHWLTERFIIECKHYKNLEWTAFIYGRGFLWTTWKKLISQCIEFNRAPMLIVKQNNYPELLIVDDDVYDFITENHIINPLITYWNPEVFIYDLFDFMAHVHFENIFKMV